MGQERLNGRCRASIAPEQVQGPRPLGLWRVPATRRRAPRWQRRPATDPPPPLPEPARARLAGLGRTLVGCLVLAFVTSLAAPSVSIEAVRQGRPGMAVANIVGSNEFNIAILGLGALTAPRDSPLSTPGPLAAQVPGLCGS